MFMRQLVYLVALDRHRHFARAAEACHVSQPALSAGLAELERELGITIIKRNRSFQGITPEGERVLAWAHQVLASLDGLKQEAALVRQVVGGHVAIGTIPSAVAPLSALVSAFRESFPALTLEVHALSTPELYRRIKKGEVDFAVVYADAQEEDGFDYLPLFTERHVLIAHDGVALPEHIGWKEVASLPLCLLSGEMHNRRIIDRIFAGVGVKPDIVLETNAVEVLLSQVRGGTLVSVLPEGALPVEGLGADIHMHAIDPQQTSAVGLIRQARKVQPPLSEALWALSRRLDPAVFAGNRGAAPA
ncbi:LysR family transcriptional regulator [Novosphingobium terrae]|uniref:LysR family transcriptional regulator n=1 Tax=Novosphingobium terrae TaxID=2726189 RepID=UPI001980C6A9|nr:LysR family transcriptional regulator [Novosphingobium terrae]